MVLVSSLPTEIFSSLLIWLHLVAASASLKCGFSRTTLKTCTVRAFALSRVPASPPYTMLMFVWFCVCFGALFGLIWEV
ncbi:unnamed protein product, partial [Prunus brigantina]